MNETVIRTKDITAYPIEALSHIITQMLKLVNSWCAPLLFDTLDCNAVGKTNRFYDR
jgi:hypothetical protein